MAGPAEFTTASLQMELSSEYLLTQGVLRSIEIMTSAHVAITIAPTPAKPSASSLASSLSSSSSFSELDSFQHKCAYLQAEVENLRAEKAAALNSEITTRDKLAAVDRDRSKALRSLAKLKDHAKERQALQEQRTKLNAELAVMEDDLVVSRNTFGRWNTEADSVASGLQHSEMTQRLLLKRLELIETTRAKLEATIGTLKGKLTFAEGCVSELSRRSDQAEARAWSLETDLTAALGRFTAGEAVAAAKLNKAHLALEASLGALANAQAAAMNAETARSEASTACAAAASEAGSAQEGRAAARSQIACLENQVRDTEGREERLMTVVNELRGELNSAEACAQEARASAAETNASSIAPISRISCGTRSIDAMARKEEEEEEEEAACLACFKRQASIDELKASQAEAKHEARAKMDKQGQAARGAISSLQDKEAQLSEECRSLRAGVASKTSALSAALSRVQVLEQQVKTFGQRQQQLQCSPPSCTNEEFLKSLTITAAATTTAARTVTPTTTEQAIAVVVSSSPLADVVLDAKKQCAAEELAAAEGAAAATKDARALLLETAAAAAEAEVGSLKQALAESEAVSNLRTKTLEAELEAATKGRQEADAERETAEQAVFEAALEGEELAAAKEATELAAELAAETHAAALQAKEAECELVKAERKAEAAAQLAACEALEEAARARQRGLEAEVARLAQQVLQVTAQGHEATAEAALQAKDAACAEAARSVELADAEERCASHESSLEACKQALDAEKLAAALACDGAEAELKRALERARLEHASALAAAGTERAAAFLTVENASAAVEVRMTVLASELCCAQALLEESEKQRKGLEAAAAAGAVEESAQKVIQAEVQAAQEEAQAAQVAELRGAVVKAEANLLAAQKEAREEAEAAERLRTQQAAEFEVTSLRESNARTSEEAQVTKQHGEQLAAVAADAEAKHFQELKLLTESLTSWAHSEIEAREKKCAEAQAAARLAEAFSRTEGEEQKACLAKHKRDLQAHFAKEKVSRDEHAKALEASEKQRTAAEAKLKALQQIRSRLSGSAGAVGTVDTASTAATAKRGEFAKGKQGAKEASPELHQQQLQLQVQQAGGGHTNLKQRIHHVVKLKEEVGRLSSDNRRLGHDLWRANVALKAAGLAPFSSLVRESGGPHATSGHGRVVESVVAAGSSANDEEEEEEEEDGEVASKAGCEGRVAAAAVDDENVESETKKGSIVEGKSGRGMSDNGNRSTNKNGGDRPSTATFVLPIPDVTLPTSLKKVGSVALCSSEKENGKPHTAVVLAGACPSKAAPARPTAKKAPLGVRKPL